MTKLSGSPNPKEGVAPEEDPDLMAYIQTMVFQDSKTEFQGSLVENTEDCYEEARKLITEGMDENQLAAVSQSEVGKQHVELIRESMEKLERAFTKLREMR